MVFKIRIGSDLDWIISDRIRILKFTNYRIANFQSDPMHTFIMDIYVNMRKRKVPKLESLHTNIEHSNCVHTMTHVLIVNTFRLGPSKLMRKDVSQLNGIDNH